MKQTDTSLFPFENLMGAGTLVPGQIHIPTANRSDEDFIATVIQDDEKSELAQAAARVQQEQEEILHDQPLRPNFHHPSFAPEPDRLIFYDAVCGISKASHTL